MKRSARSHANRRNARFSTGPKTVAGKLRVARNALRHGLAIPAGQDPDLSAEIERLAVVLAGERAEPTCLEAARRIAEAQMNLLRVRRVRYALFADQAAGSNGSRERSSTSRHDNSPPGSRGNRSDQSGITPPSGNNGHGDVATPWRGRRGDRRRSDVARSL